MSDEKPIGPGDLVWVAQDCCGKYLGAVFTVGRLSVTTEEYQGNCRDCNYMTGPNVVMAWNEHIRQGSRAGVLPRKWLRRFKPLGDMLTQEDLKQIGRTVDRLLKDVNLEEI